MKILICSTGYNSIKSNNTIGIFQLDQAKALRDIGNDIRIASIDLRSIRRKRRFGTYMFDIDGIKTATSNFPYGGLDFYGIEQWIAEKCAQNVYNLITEDGWIPDIIHAHFCDVAAAFSDIAREEEIPFVVTEHYSKLHQKTIKKDVFLAAQKAYANANELIAVSKSLADSIYEKMGYKAKVIHNIVDTDVFEPKHNARRDGYYTFISAGHLKYVKGMDILIEAFSRIKTDNVRLIILGEGIERDKLEKLAKERKCASKIQFKGEYKRTEFQSAMENSDCFVLASRSETFGVVYIEAMAAGIPVIGTSCGGPSEFISDETGMLIPVDNVDALVQAMEYMIKYSTRFDGNGISRYVKSRFEKTVIANKIQEVYNEVVKHA